MTEQQMIEHTQRLIAIQSTGDNLPALHQAVDYIAAILADHKNITVERFESRGIPSLLAYYGPERPERFAVMLNGHVDVVPAKPHQFAPYIKDGRLYGRGAYDMKTAALVMTDVFIQHGNTPGRPTALQIVADEEIGGYDGVQCQFNNGVSADFTIMGEMTNLGICNEARGLCWTEVNFKGTAAHGGYVWNGDNAIAKASSFVNALLAKFPVPKEQEWRTTASISSINTGNETYNIVPNDATVKVDFRFTPEDPDFKDEASVKALIASISPEAVVVNMPVFEQAVSTPATNPYLRHFMNAYKRVTNQETTLVRRYASSDGRHFAMRRMASIEFGLGGADHHSEVEYVELATIKPFYDTLRIFLQSPAPMRPEALREQPTAHIAA